jgi:hypothetical protein
VAQDLKPLIIDEIGTGLRIEGSTLQVEVKQRRLHEVVAEYAPHDGDFDTIVVSRALGYISFSAIDWCSTQGIDILFLDAHGHLKSPCNASPLSDKFSFETGTVPSIPD